MKIKLKHSKKNLLYLETIVFLVLSIIYVYIIKDVYGYMGFDGEISGIRILFGHLFFIPLLILGNSIKEEFFFTIWHIIFVLYLFGQIIFYQYGDGSIKPVISNTILLLVLYACSYIKFPFKIYQLKGRLLEMMVLVSLLLFIPIFIRYLPHVNPKNLLLSDIYVTRFYFRDFEDSYFGYLRAPLSRVVLPTFLVIALIKRKIWLAVLSGGMIMFIFMVGALKSIFIGMIAAIFFYLGKRFIDKVYLLLYLFLALSFFGLIIYLINGNTFLLSSFVRRVLFIPAMIDNHFYQLFENTPLYWSHNPIGALFFEYPFERPPNMHIGEVVMGREGVSANVGLVTEGFFSLNFLGVFLHSLFFGFLFIVLKQMKIKPVFFGLIFVYIYYLNTSFLTVLLITHGLFFFLLFAYFFLNKEYG